MIDDEYKTFQVNISGQLVTLETDKMVMLVTRIEQWVWRLKKRWKRNTNKWDRE